MNTLSIVLLVLFIAAVAAVVLLFLKVQKQAPTIISLQKDLEHAQARVQEVNEEADKRIQAQREEADKRIQAQREETDKRLQAQRELFDVSIQEMKESMKNTTMDALKQRQAEFAQSSSERLAQILDPLKRDLESMQKSVTENKEKQIELHTSMGTRIDELLRQSTLTAKSADALADALKNRGKVHGDWGESVLEDILSESGLREGVEFERQSSTRDANDADHRTDVIVHFPEGKNIVIDSKVSLTAYTDALEAITDEDRKNAVKRHCSSVKDHIKELMDKRYQNYVENAMPYVLMFIPNEGAYVMALNDNPRLLQEAYRQGVIIVNPTNLMMTLHLVLIAWQQTRQEDNCKLILKIANNLYEKMVTVVDSFTTLGNQLNTASNTYKRAMGQLSEGTGNLFSQTEGLKELGITSTKKRSKQLNNPTAATPELSSESPAEQEE